MISLILIEDFMKVNFQSIFQQNQTFVPNKADQRSVISNNYPINPSHPCSKRIKQSVFKNKRISAYATL